MDLEKREVLGGGRELRSGCGERERSGGLDGAASAFIPYSGVRPADLTSQVPSARAAKAHKREMEDLDWECVCPRQAWQGGSVQGTQQGGEGGAAGSLAAPSAGGPRHGPHLSAGLLAGRPPHIPGVCLPCAPA